MRENWNNLTELVQKIINDYAVVINGLRSSGDVTKIKKAFQKNVKEISKAIDEFDVLVPDPERCEIELPFDSEDFESAWSEYKEFLMQEHHFALTEVVEKKRLTMLFRFSAKNVSKAIEILDHLISTRQKNIFKPSDFQLSGDQPGNDSEASNFVIKKKTL